MYLHLGGETIVRTEDITGIFDLDNATVSYRTREFLSFAQKNGKVVNVSDELPKSFVLCTEEGETVIYICQLSPNTLIRRTEQELNSQ